MNRRWRKFKVTLPSSDLNISPNNNRENIKFDAIFISTKNNKERLGELLLELKNLKITKLSYVIPSSKNDSPSIMANAQNMLEEFRSFCKTRDIELGQLKWDLPYKRNFAVWYGKLNSYKKILLLDDDIRFTTFESSVQKLLYALDQNWVAGAYSTGEFDTSLTGSVAMKLGIKRPGFLSGNCLAINLNTFIPYFPYIYNEDWLALLPAIIKKKATIVGPILQLPKIVSKVDALSKFQEFGEIIADEIYSHITHPFRFKSLLNLIDCINHCDHWENVFEDRYQWLMTLKTLVCIENNDGNDLRILDAACSELAMINSSDCVTFLNKWQGEYSSWVNSLKYQPVVLN